MLHGRFGDEDAMWLFRRTMPAGWLKIAPRAPQPDPRGGHSWALHEDGVWPDLPAFAHATAALTHFLQALPRVYNSDPASTYLLGFSQGAAAAYALAMTQPGLAAAVAGLVGFVPQGGDGAALRGLPVFTAVGRRDRFVPYARAMQDVNWLHEVGAALEHHEYDAGHKMTAAGLRDLTAWWRER
jgi:phospholipase/carboxylesterase